MIKKIQPIILGLIVFPASVFALQTPSATVPETMDADYYTLVITVAPGSKVTVLGGPSFIGPVTDGAGKDPLDGKVEVMVGLAQNQENTFNINAEKNGEVSEVLVVKIREEKKESVGSSASQGDTTPPPALVIDEIPAEVTGTEYTIKGSAEADANIYVRMADGSKAGSTSANSEGLFEVTVDLETGKTNRFNLYAEDAAYNASPETQVVIRVVAKKSADVNVANNADNKSGYEGTNRKHSFLDLKNHWSADFVTELYEKGVVNGKSDTEFAPNDLINRAAITKIALKAFGHEIEEVDEAPFADVKKSDWFAPYVAKAKALKIVSGFKDGFHPGEPITRAGALKILLEASGLDIGDDDAGFSDVGPNDWFKKYVAFAKKNDIVGGYEKNQFRPKNNITRGEVAKIVVKMIELKHKIESEQTLY